MENEMDMTKRQNDDALHSGSRKRPCKPMSSPIATQKQYNMDFPTLHESPILCVATFCEGDSSIPPELLDVQPPNDLSGRSDMKTLNGKFLSAQTLIRILRSTTTPDHDLIPEGIKQNVYSTINNWHNIERRKRGKQSVFCDDCGVWDRKLSSTKVVHFVDTGNNSVQFVNKVSGNWCKGKKLLEPQPDETSIYSLRRFHATLQRDKGYKKRVSWIEGGPTIALVEYIGTFPTKRNFHGSCKRSVGEYVKKGGAVKDAIVRAVKTGKAPRDIYQNMVLDDSDMAPRDRKQVENVKYALNKQERKESGKVGHQTNLVDEIVSLVRDISGCEHEFIKELVHIGGQPPSVILYTAEQLHDFATSEKTVFGVDCTLNLGPCFVTFIVYKSKRLLRKSSQENPVMLGPIYLHWNATFFTYSRFFTHISAKLEEKGMKNLDSITLGLSDLIIGSDEELALNKAMKYSFPGTKLLLCTRHLEENAKRHLSAESMEQSKKEETMNEIFGRNCLLTMDDSYEFDERSQRMRLKFEKDFPRFAKYFREKLVPALRSHVFQPQRNHNLPFKWTNNNCESMNHIYKLQTDGKPQKITDLIDSLERIVQLQYQDMKRALYGEGSYQLAPGYHTHKIARITWIGKSKTEKEALFMKFLKSKPKQCSKKKYVTSTDGLYTIPRMPRVARKPGQTKRPRNAKTRTIRVVTGRVRSGLKSTVEADEGLQGDFGQTGISVPEIDCRRMEPHHVTGRVRSGLKSTVEAVEGLQGVCDQTGISVLEIEVDSGGS
ncbi:uncharacterized protein LOC143018598 [Oratosquilla oratoria]|uniref:uncharacterized protein LOC143018598 n=1 Tax=Oratosquilla oratoria TaxID=337810 RepID=UPI003F76614C